MPRLGGVPVLPLRFGSLLVNVRFALPRTSTLSLRETAQDTKHNRRRDDTRRRNDKDLRGGLYHDLLVRGDDLTFGVDSGSSSRDPVAVDNRYLAGTSYAVGMLDKVESSYADVETVGIAHDHDDTVPLALAHLPGKI